ncbi:MAG TPA: hypothetical protein VNU01_02945 [Egibacteraceae bacterium]|nr:hypothetical protein [Egibacteraceae bacterium]
MLEREWVSITDPTDDHDRYVFDVTFLLSGYRCIYGAGCQGIGPSGVASHGCCSLGAHYADADDRERVEAMAARLGPEFMQFHREAARGGVTARLPGEEFRTRIVQGGCIFLNRQDWPAGAGCALHQYAVARGEHYMTYKPEVCWIVPLRREVVEDVADDGEPLWVTTITSYDRGAWGGGGAAFAWWCIDAPEAYGAPEPVYRSMERELRALSSDAVYEELAAYLDDRRATARKPLPMLIEQPR